MDIKTKIYGWEGAQLSEPLAIEEKEDLNRLLSIAANYPGLTDVIMQSGQPIFFSCHGALWAATRPVHNNKLEMLMRSMTGKESITNDLKGGSDYDTAFNIPDLTKTDEYGNWIKHRFRLNLTPNYYDDSIGYQAVLRYIKSSPPTIGDVTLEPHIVANIAPQQGMVIIIGETGSGKTTTFAAGLRYILEGNTHIRGNIITYEWPIEYLYDKVKTSTCTISQHEIGQHLQSFDKGVRNSLRRKPGLVMIGELRDKETMMAAVEASNTGHPVFATTHANSVAHAYRRMALKFPQDMQEQAYNDLLNTSYLLIAQTLVRRADDETKYACLREWQLITKKVRDELELAGPERSQSTMETIINRDEDGQCMRTSVIQALKAGMIAKQTAEHVLLRYGYRGVNLDV